MSKKDIHITFCVILSVHVHLELVPY